MNIIEAARALNQGSHICRKSTKMKLRRRGCDMWAITFEDGTPANQIYTPHLIDLLADDWYVVEKTDDLPQQAVTPQNTYKKLRVFNEVGRSCLEIANLRMTAHLSSDMDGSRSTYIGLPNNGAEIDQKEMASIIPHLQSFAMYGSFDLPTEPINVATSLGMNKMKEVRDKLSNRLAAGLSLVTVLPRNDANAYNTFHRDLCDILVALNATIDLPPEQIVNDKLWLEIARIIDTLADGLVVCKDEKVLRFIARAHNWCIAMLSTFKNPEPATDNKPHTTGEASAAFIDESENRHFKTNLKQSELLISSLGNGCVKIQERSNDSHFPNPYLTIMTPAENEVLNPGKSDAIVVTNPPQSIRLMGEKSVRGLYDLLKSYFEQT